MKPYYQDEWVTIYHGDCRGILPQLPDNSVDLVLTDPPYGAEINYGVWDDTFDNWKLLIDSTLPQLKLMAKSILLATGRLEGELYLYGKYPPDWRLCWYKGATASRCKVGFRHWEMMMFWGDQQAEDNSPDYFWATPPPPNKHPCPKPDKWADWLLTHFSKVGDLILDPFLGSGTTAYCAKKLNRKCIGIEIEERYAEIAANRCRQMVMELNG